MSTPHHIRNERRTRERAGLTAPGELPASIPGHGRGYAYCGAKIEAHEWMWHDADHAALAALNGDTGIAACSICVHLIRRALEKLT